MPRPKHDAVSSTRRADQPITGVKEKTTAIPTTSRLRGIYAPILPATKCRIFFLIKRLTIKHLRPFPEPDPFVDFVFIHNICRFAKRQTQFVFFQSAAQAQNDKVRLFCKPTVLFIKCSFSTLDNQFTPVYLFVKKENKLRLFLRSEFVLINYVLR